MFQAAKLLIFIWTLLRQNLTCAIFIQEMIFSSLKVVRVVIHSTKPCSGCTVPPRWMPWSKHYASRFNGIPATPHLNTDNKVHGSNGIAPWRTFLAKWILFIRMGSKVKIAVWRGAILFSRCQVEGVASITTWMINKRDLQVSWHLFLKYTPRYVWNYRYVLSVRRWIYAKIFL